MGTPENLSQGKLHLIKVTTPEWDTATEILLNNFSNLKSTTEKYDLKKKKITADSLADGSCIDLLKQFYAVTLPCLHSKVLGFSLLSSVLVTIKWHSSQGRRTIYYSM